MGLQKFEIDPELFVASMDRRSLIQQVKDFVASKLRGNITDWESLLENFLRTITEEPFE